MKAFRNETQNNFDALFKRDEDREHEYLSIRNQGENLDKRVAAIEKKPWQRR